MKNFGEQPELSQPTMPENPIDLQKETSKSTTPETPVEQPELPKEVNIKNIVEALGDAEIPSVSYVETTLRSILMDKGMDEEDAGKIRIEYDGDAYGGSISVDGIKVFDYTENPEDPDGSFNIIKCDEETLRGVLEKYGKGTK